MLGRYVAGTLMVLGVAMIMAPETPEQSETSVEVARADTAPATLTVDKELADPEQASRERAAHILAAADSTQAAQLTLAAASALETPVVETPVVSEAVAPLVTRPAVQESPETVEVATAEPQPVATPDPAPALYVVTGSRVNVRSGPGTNHGIISSVRRGDEVEILSPDGQSWAEIRITTSGKTGFMARRFISDLPTGG